MLLFTFHVCPSSVAPSIPRHPVLSKTTKHRITKLFTSVITREGRSIKGTREFLTKKVNLLVKKKRKKEKGKEAKNVG